jgi:phosphoribosylaminoimidazolecarboxamide formyltransferase/IMP cyclohydrolase
MIKRAIISVFDKKSLDVLLKVLEKFNVEIISSGGTARRIREIGYTNILDVSNYTGCPESPGGLVKTLHPKVHGGLLLNRDDPLHKKWMTENRVKPVDMVVCNLYPFEKIIEEGANLGIAIHNIDIGGPTMIRSAAKAGLLYDTVCIVIAPEQYPEIIKTLEENNGKLTSDIRRRYAMEAFKRTRDYDTAIAKFLEDNI